MSDWSLDRAVECTGTSALEAAFDSFSFLVPETWRPPVIA
jgi:hypothetical protein